MNHNEPYNDEYLQDILSSVKTIAMVGASPDKTKFSYGDDQSGCHPLYCVHRAMRPKFPPSRAATQFFLHVAVELPSADLPWPSCWEQTHRIPVR